MLAETEDVDPEDIAYFKWASAEWAYEAFADAPFDPICRQLRAACQAVASDAMAFAAFKAEVHQAMIEALKQLDEEGFFGDRRAGAALFITSSDADEAEEMEDRSARLLNPPDQIADFLKRYGGHIR